jgi:hypothetical protein
LQRSVNDSMQNKLNTGTLEEIIQTVSNAVKLTHDRIRFVRSTKREEPHIKLLIIDLVNYLMGLLGNEERKILV